MSKKTFYFFIFIFGLLPLIAYKHNPNPNSSFQTNQESCENKNSKACNANYEYLSFVEGNQRDALLFAKKSCALNDFIGCFGAAFIYAKHISDLDRAFEYFEAGLKLGYNNWSYLEADSPLKILKSDARYLKLIKQYKSLNTP